MHIQNILRMEQVARVVSLHPATIYRRIASNTFPRPIPLGDKAVGWLESEIAEWQAARINERDTGAK